MIKGEQQKRTGLGLVIGIICTLVWVTLMPGSTEATPSLLPPIGTLTPSPTTQPSPVPTVLPEATNTHIALQTPDGWAGKWTVVQWQDGLGTWHDVEGWMGEISNENLVVWTVLPTEQGSGPFRWLVYTAPEGDLLSCSDPFYAPSLLGDTTWVWVPVVPTTAPTGAPAPEAGNRMRVRPPEGESPWLDSALDDWTPAPWFQMGSIVTVMGGRRPMRTARDGGRWRPTAG